MSNAQPADAADAQVEAEVALALISSEWKIGQSSGTFHWLDYAIGALLKRGPFSTGALLTLYKGTKLLKQTTCTAQNLGELKHMALEWGIRTALIGAEP